MHFLATLLFNLNFSPPYISTYTYILYNVLDTTYLDTRRVDIEYPINNDTRACHASLYRCVTFTATLNKNVTFNENYLSRDKHSVAAVIARVIKTVDNITLTYALSLQV